MDTVLRSIPPAEVADLPRHPDAPLLLDLRRCHQGELCSFDARIAAYGSQEPALHALAASVRGDYAERLDFTPQSAGLRAVSFGLSQLHPDGQHMLQAALPICDALYASCRNAQRQPHGRAPKAMRGFRP